MGTSDSKDGAPRRIFVDPGYKRVGQGAFFPRAGVSNQVAAEWMSRTRVLYDKVQAPCGHLTMVPKHPQDSVPAPGETILKE
eukprot:1790270-Lingulodinium_polyedra.AAC.1